MSAEKAPLPKKPEHNPRIRPEIIDKKKREEQERRRDKREQPSLPASDPNMNVQSESFSIKDSVLEAAPLDIKIIEWDKQRKEQEREDKREQPSISIPVPERPKPSKPEDKHPDYDKDEDDSDDGDSGNWKRIEIQM